MGSNHMRKNFDDAEKRARERDIKKEIDLNTVAEQEKKANELGYGIYKKRDKNHAKFTQNVTENIDYLVAQKWVTLSEFGFLTAIQPLIEYSINAIYNSERNTFMTITEIAEYINQNRSTVSRTIKSLMRKGLLFEFVDQFEIEMFDRRVSTRTIFVNPELFYNGDRNKIDSTLAVLIMENDRLERQGIKLPWKVYRRSGDDFGRLYRRKTYLELKKIDRAKR